MGTLYSDNITYKERIFLNFLFTVANNILRVLHRDPITLKDCCAAQNRLELFPTGTRFTEIGVPGKATIFYNDYALNVLKKLGYAGGVGADIYVTLKGLEYIKRIINEEEGTEEERIINSLSGFREGVKNILSHFPEVEEWFKNVARADR